MKEKRLKVVELFAGVGGFRIGLQDQGYDIIWSNQWEPSTKVQHASLVYEARFGSENHYNENIESIDIGKIPDHDLLVGGFPCQDYSVATTLNNSKGLLGKKGILWWSIYNILVQKKNKPKYLLLENVDRLLKSPSNQRGRDFAVMLQSLNELDYAVEWRVINAADYGMPQRRRRIFILAYHKDANIYEEAVKSRHEEWIVSEGIMARSFPVKAPSEADVFKLDGDLVSLTESFNVGKKLSPFKNSGVMINGEVTTIKTLPLYDGERLVLADILDHELVADEFYIDEREYPKWDYLKGAKKIERTSTEGFVYQYSEGGMVFPDDVRNPSRTIVTGEGGKTPSRFKHVIQSKKGLRRLTPLELERLNMFPDNHTELSGITNAKRAFFMGNALVVGVVEKIGKELYHRAQKLS